MNSSNKLFKHLMGVACVTALLLLIPLIGMQFTDEILWTYTDFIFAGILLFGTGTAFVFVLTNKGNNFRKIALGIAIVASFLIVWVNGAVGIVGHEGEPINMLYYAVLAIGLIGAFLTRLQAKGMSYTLFAMVAALVIITIIALMGYLQEPPHNTAVQIVGVNTFFVVLFSLSAISFRNASIDSTTTEVLNES